MAEVHWDDSDLRRELGKKFKSGMNKAALFCERKAKQLVSRGNKTGDDPSDPGEPPKTVTGRLRSSISHEVFYSPNDPLGVKGYVGSNVEYALYLELGTEKMEPRPFLRPTVFNNQSRILKLIADG